MSEASDENRRKGRPIVPTGGVGPATAPLPPWVGSLTSGRVDRGLRSRDARGTAAARRRGPRLPALLAAPTRGDRSPQRRARRSGGRALDPARFGARLCIAFAPQRSPAPHRLPHAVTAGPDPAALASLLAGRQIGEATENLAVALDALPCSAPPVTASCSTAPPSNPVARPLPGTSSAGDVHRAGRSPRPDRARRLREPRRANILIGLYLNASDSASLGGGLTLYDAARPFSPASRRLARLVQRNVLAALRSRGWDVPDDGVHDDSGYGSLVTSADQAYGHLLILGPPKAGYLATPSEMPGALTEPLFVTDPAEASIAAGAAGRRAIARGSSRPSASTSPPAPQSRARVSGSRTTGARSCACFRPPACSPARRTCSARPRDGGRREPPRTVHSAACAASRAARVRTGRRRPRSTRRAPRARRDRPAPPGVS